MPDMSAVFQILGEIFGLGQGLGARHQLDVGAPEAFLVGDRFDQLGGAPSQVVAAQRALAKAVAQTLSEVIAKLGDLLVRGAAIGTSVAPVLDEREARAVGAEHMVGSRIDLSVETTACGSLVQGLVPVTIPIWEKAVRGMRRASRRLSKRRYELASELMFSGGRRVRPKERGGRADPMLRADETILSDKARCAADLESAPRVRSARGQPLDPSAVSVSRTAGRSATRIK
jgi:hypothetical protein